MPSLYAPVWYNDQKLSWREKLTTTNRYSIRVGAPRLRQLRVKESKTFQLMNSLLYFHPQNFFHTDTCSVLPKFKNLIGHCRDNYNWVDDDTKDYDEYWLPVGTAQSVKLARAAAKQEAESSSSSSVNSNDTNTTTTTSSTTTTTTTPISITRKTKYKCKTAWCYQVKIFFCFS